MPKARTNIYVTERQRKQLEKRSRDEDLPMAEIIRRALDAYLAWDDPAYHDMSCAREQGKMPEEVTLAPCPYCRGLHLRGTIELCPLKPAHEFLGIDEISTKKA